MQKVWKNTVMIYLLNWLLIELHYKYWNSLAQMIPYFLAYDIISNDLWLAHVPVSAKIVI